MQFLQYLRRYYPAGSFVGCIVLCVASGILPAVQIRVQGSVIDAAVQGEGMDFWRFLLVYLLVLSSGSAIGVLLQRNAQKHKNGTGYRLDSRRVEKANAVRFSVTETERFHSLLEKARSAPAQDEKLYGAIQTVLVTGTAMISSIAVLLAIDLWTVAGIALLLMVGLWLNIRLAKKTDGFWSNYIDNMRVTNYLSTLLLQREYSAERKLFAFGEEIGARFQREFSEAKQENQKLGKERLKIECQLELFSAAYSVIAVMLLLRPLAAGTISIGIFTSAFYAANALRKACSRLYDGAFSLLGSWKQMASFFAFLELPEEAAPAPPSGNRRVTVTLRDVGFTYPGESEPVLSHISLCMEPGKHYALVGENGSGKTTLAKLLVGLYEPTHGAIIVDGRDVTALPPEERRKIFSAVFQDFYRYPLSIRENVTLGAEHAVPEARIREVFRALDFAPAALRQPGGLDKPLQRIKKESADLSGGEWQKLAIARCVLSERSAAVLDEPNAALDPIAEAQVYRAYRELLRDKTTLFITHRLGAVKMADEIFVLRDGKILDSGSPAHLMAHCPYYATLFETQRRMYHEA